MSSFCDTVCVVTGAASGMGRALCAALADAGATVVAADLRAEAVDDWATELRERGGRVEAEALDVRDAEAFERLIGRVVEQHGRVDYLFNNAGVVIVREARQLSLADWHTVLDVNLWGVIHGCQATYARMVEQGHGHIVNTASLVGLLPTPLIVPYVAGKHAVVGLSEALRAEGADLGVRVSAVCPGAVRTPLLEGRPGDDAEVIAVLARVMERAVTPEAAARTILRGVERNRALILFPWSVRLAVGLYRHLPGLTRWLLRRAAQRARSLHDGSDSGVPVDATD